MCVLCAAILIGCSKTETGNSNMAMDNSNRGTTTTTTATTAPASEKIGVPECDDFIAKYDACVSSKVPEMVRGQYKEAVKQWREGWKKLAEDPNSRPRLVAACKEAAEKQAAALKAYGCTW